MSEDIFDAIIVGAGLAGCTAGYLLAKAGLEVLVIERGNSAGSKNMTGGRLYAHSLERIIPGFADEAPVERRVTREKISFLTEDSAVTLDYQRQGGATPLSASYTVLRGSFDQWLMEKAEAEGAQFVPGVRVDELLFKDGKVAGVKAGDEVLEGRVVILADGVNSLLGEKAGLVSPVSPHHVAVGVKELIELTPTQMHERFGISGDEGLAWLFAGSPSNGQLGGGFLYTNKTTVSLGLVFGLHGITATDRSVPQMLEDFKNHPFVQPLIAGGELLEYSAHVVPEGGLNMMPEIVGNGVLIAGDAAGLCINAGYTIRGMDLAVASGEAAAKTVIEAKRTGDYSATGLARYRSLLQESFVLHDMHLYKKLPAFLENPRMFTEYPRLVTGIFSDIFTVDGTPERPVWRKLLARGRQVGLLNLMKDGIKGVRAL